MLPYQLIKTNPNDLKFKLPTPVDLDNPIFTFVPKTDLMWEHRWSESYKLEPNASRQPTSIITNNDKKSVKVTLNIDPTDPNANPFLFVFEGIEIRGTPTKPLFNARHLAEKIDDGHNYLRQLEDLSQEDIINEMSKNANGKLIKTPFLTEFATYQYLMKSSKDKAEHFQKQIYDMLIAIREQLITEMQVKNKIMKDKINTMDLFNNTLKPGEYILQPTTTSEDIVEFAITKFILEMNIPRFDREYIGYKHYQFMIKLAKYHLSLPEFVYRDFSYDIEGPIYDIYSVWRIGFEEQCKADYRNGNILELAQSLCDTNYTY